MNKLQNNEVERVLATCLPEFSDVNHYWDKNRLQVVAKIMPGEFYVTKQPVVIATTLGSCIAACIWDINTGVGGMNHFMLPSTKQTLNEVNWGSRQLLGDATRFGNFAMEHLINVILANGGRRINLRAKVFGGGKVLNISSDVGQNNIDFVLNYLDIENIKIESTDVGHSFPRKLIFNPITGKALVKKLGRLPNDYILKRDLNYLKNINKASVSGDVDIF